MFYKIDYQNCTNCGSCLDFCINGALIQDAFTPKIDNKWCVDCGSCFASCEHKAILFSTEEENGMQKEIEPRDDAYVEVETIYAL